MKKSLPIIAVLLIFLVSCATNPKPQLYHIDGGTVTTPSDADENEFPQWARDLRRYEIVSLGTFPFTWLVATTAVDLVRSAQNNWDSKYYPWPAKPADGLAMTNDEYIITIGTALGISAVIGIIDFFIVKYKRNKTSAKKDDLPKGEPIIIRKPIEEMIDEDKE